MALCCQGTGDTVKEFTVLLIHVLHVSHPAALEGSTRYAREIVDRFFQEHTGIDNRPLELYNYKFCNLVAESRLEIALVGRPKKFKVPSYKTYKYEHLEGLAVVFEVETRLIQRYIPLNSEFEFIEVERTDFLPLTGCTQRHIADMMVSYVNA